ncbi:hypothetical protein CEP88_13145 [Roseobacter denitrificans]|nr:hypothetical protein CEP88_13145 [Roseobacter denitrificans]
MVKKTRDSIPRRAKKRHLMFPEGSSHIHAHIKIVVGHLSAMPDRNSVMGMPDQMNQLPDSIE